MKLKLIAFDMDGTFLDDGKNIPPENLQALQEANGQGIVLVPATGRIYAGIPQIIKDLPFIRYFILGNGAQVFDRETGQVLYRGEISLPLCLRVLDYMETLPVIYDCYQDGQGWMSEHMFRRIEEFMPDPVMVRYTRSVRTTVPDLRSFLEERGRPVQKLQMHFRDMKELARQRKLLPEIFPELLACSSVKTNIELNSIDAGKDKGLQALCRHLGIDICETLAFGDGSNDTAMLKAAGWGVAMANAEEEVLTAADAITVSNNEAGVAAAMRRWALN